MLAEKDILLIETADIATGKASLEAIVRLFTGLAHWADNYEERVESLKSEEYVEDEISKLMLTIMEGKQEDAVSSPSVSL